MEEKVLIEAKFSKINPLAQVCFWMAGIAVVACFLVAMIIGGSPAWAFQYFGYGYYWFFIGATVFVVMGAILASMKFELIVTEGKVVGKTLFGKRVDLPISQISVAGTGIFKRVSIATSSGAIIFYGVINQEEVFTTISGLLLKRQEETKTNSKASESTSEELKKFKQLLDEGVITQEEFDAKKKKLLGL